MGGNRRFRGMKRPASKGYSKVSMMEDDSKRYESGTQKCNLFFVIVVVFLCIATLVAATLLIMTFALESQNSTTKDSGESYTSTSFLTHRPYTLSFDEANQITRGIDIDHLFSVELSPLLIKRDPDTPGNERAREHITSRLESHGMWTIELDEFQDSTPIGTKKFVNIVATLRPEIKRRLVLACHYDSKYFAPRSDGKVFIGATDSAVPCAMMLDLANNLANLLRSTTQVSTSLQLIFFDGEEAFRHWSDKDSLYGARHLAAKMLDTPHPPKSTKTNQLDAMDMFILLDLIGAPNPNFRNYFPATSFWFKRLQNIEKRLREQGAINAKTTSYFDTRSASGNGIQDDHIPFLHRGMNRIIHLIASPFPRVWHTMDDNRDALDPPSIDDLNKILHVFVVEYLHLLDSQPASTAA
ncbi:glutaminyl-peptide cyclotransferase-like isoform X2 [Apostichopus japonicus]|uniref:glutaminyl-peptide cyclotransferase-like isoform X2 n=1 Tax=Stichopus japonicus TaxID=307972 RepID=UPI003AB34259